MSFLSAANAYLEEVGQMLVYIPDQVFGGNVSSMRFLSFRSSLGS